MTSPCDPPPLLLSITKYFPLQLPTIVLVYGRLHSLIFHHHIICRKMSHLANPTPPPTSRSCNAWKKKIVNVPLCCSIMSYKRWIRQFSMWLTHYHIKLLLCWYFFLVQVYSMSLLACIMLKLNACSVHLQLFHTVIACLSTWWHVGRRCVNMVMILNNTLFRAITM